MTTRKAQQIIIMLNLEESHIGKRWFLALVTYLYLVSGIYSNTTSITEKIINISTNDVNGWFVGSIIDNNFPIGPFIKVSALLWREREKLNINKGTI